VNLDPDIGGRNCDRAVKRSTALEQGDEILALLRTHALQVKPQVDGIEESDIRSDGMGAVHLSRDRDAGGPQGNAAVFRQDLKELDPAGGDT